MCSGFTLLYSGNEHNALKQLYFDKNELNETHKKGCEEFRERRF